ncbi:MAG: hypothetical protein GY795_23165 [Desulfobacterales bacterium]|nr:hypothetical protein [Desulfobacterales bacterium]
MKFWQTPGFISAKISFRHSFESVSYFWNKMKDAKCIIHFLYQPYL